MNLNQLPYEQQLEAIDYGISSLTKRKADLIEKHMQETRSPEVTEGYELTEDKTFARYLISLGHRLPVYRDGYDRGAVMNALMEECSSEEQTAFGYMDLAKGKCREKFLQLQARYYEWRDGELDGGVA